MFKVTIQSFSYPNAEEEVLSHISFQLSKGEHLALLGESGCGKSTLLHILYGLLNLDNGEIFYGKRQLFGPSHNLIPGHDFMRLVSQDLDLMPFTTVAENIAENLSRLDKDKDQQRIDELLKTVGLLANKNKKVQLLSGGQKQRVALAKALADPPEILLLDEPFSSIDSFRKGELQRTLFRYLKENNIGCITATHHSDEALGYADSILILKEGKMISIGSPETIYKNISTVYEASFFGEATELPHQIFKVASSDKTTFLPHELQWSQQETPVKALVKNSYFKGRNYLISCDFNGKPLFFEHHRKLKKNSWTFIKPS